MITGAVDKMKKIGETTPNVYKDKDALPCNCFTVGTKVLTDEGEKPIEEIEVGDRVLSRNEETGEQAYKEVVQLFQKTSESIYIIRLDEQIVEATGNHPFWVEGKEWVDAENLEVGDVLLLSNGESIAIEDITIEGRQEVVYNFEVEDFHTYFVSDLGVWVHNETCFSPGKYDKETPSGLKYKIIIGNLGQLLEVSAKIEKKHLDKGTDTNESSRKFARSLGKPNDDAGHAIGKKLGGLGGSTSGNIFPQNLSVNRGDYRELEKRIAKEVSNDKEVNVKIRFDYDEGSTRPKKIIYEVIIDGKKSVEEFPNP
ncbi:hypothetical protein PAECIP111893_02754 [Paenibacillus plantiphilus]|uniref:Hint domain-containing protein n=1 Tax=Paenibacillus plantiphilus TaxID=2905650 RepID=A0ABN8GJP0_9BACL|nr:polymorphic toxin-type HINT domain-containing protein [Paenibacillus plantiphilus]CAH1207678.1 hypothetical protein PAECIP111893_02754 [Paenibacillus plantiphilus]